MTQSDFLPKVSDEHFDDLAASFALGLVSRDLALDGSVVTGIGSVDLALVRQQMHADPGGSAIAFSRPRFQLAS